MNKQLFRQKSMDKITSSDQINEYIHVSNPSVWIILAAVIVLLIGVCVWGIFGQLDTILQTGGVCKDGQLVFYIGESDIDKINENVIVLVDEKEFALSDISASPIKLDESYDSYLVHLTGLAEGEWVYVLKAKAVELKDGIYSIKIVTERVKPIDFVLN